MTNIKYIKRCRHRKKIHGGDSLGDNGKEEIKSFYQNEIIELLLADKKKKGFGYSKWNQLNFK
ncbi:MAG: hypothetical protein WC358_04780 [Ignavibacteria bacterium]|jgi:hypothetical protein